MKKRFVNQWSEEFKRALLEECRGTLYECAECRTGYLEPELDDDGVCMYCKDLLLEDDSEEDN
jgi:DNA-directed RNA polymerase subunit RPC12/RpoP